jgi:hypothetical protein
MITNTGKNIIGKFLLGQAPAYASYIAVGCGAKPLLPDDSFGDYSNKTNLDFEMFRVPISSRGFVNEDGVSKVVLTAELPTEERYEITEVAVYSAGANPSAGSYDSKSLFTFTDREGWEYHNQESATEIPLISEPLDGDNNDNIIDQPYNVFQTNADNRIFTNIDRLNRYERARFFNNTIFIKGDDADLTMSSGHIQINPGSNHIHLTGSSLDLTKNAPTDEIKLAFAIVNKDGSAISQPSGVRLLLDFSSTDNPEGGEFARFEVDITDGQDGYDFETNRYLVVTKQLQELFLSTNFTWNAVTVVKIYATVLYEDEPSDEFYIALDAIRLENKTTSNPIYGMTGYSVIKNTDGYPITKLPNTSNYIEFRFAMDVQ